jgi:hypothetical protein
VWETEVVQWTEQKGPFEDPDVPDRLSALAAAKGTPEIRPCFFPPEYACTDENTNAFAYETG